MIGLGEGSGVLLKEGARATITRLAVVLGLAGVGTVAIAVLAAIASYPDYSLWRQFISELGGRNNPSAWRINLGFRVGGGLIAVAMSLLAIRTAGAIRLAAILATLCGASLLLVGLFPIHRIVPHVVFSSSAFLTSTAAAISLAIGAWRSPLIDARATAAVCLITSAQCLALVGALLTAWLLIASGQLDARYTFYGPAVAVSNPFSSDSLINPIAIAEWLFLCTSLALAVGAFVGAPRLLRQPSTP